MILKKLIRGMSNLLILFFLFSFINSFSQDQKLVADSLKIELLESENDSLSLVLLRNIVVYSSSIEEKRKFSNDLLKLARSRSDSYYLCEGFKLLGVAEKIAGNLEVALENFLRAAQIAQEKEFSKLLGESYGSIATVYNALEDFNNAIFYFRKAEEIFINKHDSINIGLTAINIGYAFYNLGDYESSTVEYERAQTILQDLNYPNLLAYVQGNWALVKAKPGNYSQAERDLDAALKTLNRFGDSRAISDFLNELGIIFSQQGRFKDARNSLKRGFDLADSTGLKEQARDAAEVLMSLHANNLEYKEAYFYAQEFLRLKDSIKNEETIQQLANQRTAYEVGLKQAELDLSNAQKQSQQYFLIGTAAFALLLIALVVLVYRLLLNKQRANLQLEQLNSTKDRFFSIISHDIRGPVQAFNGVSRMIKFMVDNDQVSELRELADQIDESADRLSSLLDNLLNWAVQQQGQINYVPEKISVNEMINELTGTFTNMAQAKNIELKQDVPEGLCLWSDQNTTNTILRNLINNALKFTEENGKIEVIAKEEDDLVSIEVADTGVGIPTDKMEKLFQLEAKKSTWGTDGEKGLGLGLQLVKEFVDMNKGSISVSSEEGKGTTFVIKLPAYKD